jgi:hypothetical protein
MLFLTAAACTIAFAAIVVASEAYGRVHTVRAANASLRGEIVKLQTDLAKLDSRLLGHIAENRGSFEKLENRLCELGQGEGRSAHVVAAATTFGRDQ